MAESELNSPVSVVPRVAEADVPVGPVGGDGGDAAAPVDLRLDRPPPRAALNARDPHAEPGPAPERKGYQGWRPAALKSAQT